MEDVNILRLIKEIVDERPTYGYRRVWALLNRKLVQSDISLVNHERVYRIMKKHGLLLAPHPKKHEKHDHTGRIVTDESNQRWCNDGFELPCDNGEKVRTIFVMGCCDREINSHVVAMGGDIQRKWPRRPC